MNWHIDEKEFPKLWKLKEFNFDTEFNQYLDALLSKKCPWEEPDMQFVNAVWEKNEFIRSYGFIFSGSTLILILLGLFIGYILNDIVGCFLVINNTGTAIGTLIVIGIVIVIIGFIPGFFLAALFEGFTLSPPSSEIKVNKLRILSNDLETARICLLVISIIFTGWLVYFIFLRQWLWKDIIHHQALLSYNFHDLYAIGVAVFLLIIYRKKLIRLSTEKKINSIIDQNRERMKTVINRANNYQL
jgi:MFS family permease